MTKCNASTQSHGSPFYILHPRLCLLLYLCLFLFPHNAVEVIDHSASQFVIRWLAFGLDELVIL